MQIQVFIILHRLILVERQILLLHVKVLHGIFSVLQVLLLHLHGLARYLVYTPVQLLHLEMYLAVAYLHTSTMYLLQQQLLLQHTIIQH